MLMLLSGKCLSPELDVLLDIRCAASADDTVDDVDRSESGPGQPRSRGKYIYRPRTSYVLDSVCIVLLPLPNIPTTITASILIKYCGSTTLN